MKLAVIERSKKLLSDQVQYPQRRKSFFS